MIHTPTSQSLMANTVNPHQILLQEWSDQGLHCLHRPVQVFWVNKVCVVSIFKILNMFLNSKLVQCENCQQ